MDQKCPRCGSNNITKDGKRKNKYVTKQGYECKDCSHRFIERDGFEGMTFPKEIICKALHLYAEGLSLSKIRDYIWQHEGYYLYDSVILYWVKKYAKKLSEFERKLKPKIEGRIHMDEVHVKVKGEKAYSINAIDNKTKYNLETFLTMNKHLLSFVIFFYLLAGRIGDQVRERFEMEKHKPDGKRKLITFVSDGLLHYKTCFNDFFASVAKLVHGVPIACKKYGLEHNNNSIERQNEDIKQRYKVMRDFKSFYPADSFLKLRRIVYLFVRSHSSLKGKTPAEAAEIDLKLGRNRLLELIKIFAFWIWMVLYPSDSRVCILSCETNQVDCVNS